MSDEQPRPRCFVARPISIKSELEDRYRDGSDHWKHVHDYLLTPAIAEAGYEVVSPESTGANIIHGDIINHLNECDLVVADFSTLNPNVLFEAGVRTSVNKPLVIVAEVGTALPFDTGVINTFFYNPSLDMWDIQLERPRLTAHIQETDTGSNALWKRFAIELRSADLSTGETAEDARLQLLTEQMSSLQTTVQRALAEQGGLGVYSSRALRTQNRSAGLALKQSAVKAARAAEVEVVSVQVNPRSDSEVGTGAHGLVELDSGTTPEQRERFIVPLCEEIRRDPVLDERITSLDIGAADSSQSIRVEIRPGHHYSASLRDSGEDYNANPRDLDG